MSAGYIFKLLCLCLASFFLIHSALALLVKIATPATLRWTERMRPELAARFLFWIRMLPAGLGILAVIGICAPSYLWLEPRAATSEEIGLGCLGLAILTGTLWSVSIVRGLRAMIHSSRYFNHCERIGRKTDLPNESLSLWILEEPGALFAIGGITNPRLLVSRRVLSVLSEEQLAAAVGHEKAHWTSRDNLKRLLLMLAPDALPCLAGFSSLERGWAKYMERAADDRAVAGDPCRSIALAAALVRVSRLGFDPAGTVLAAPLLAGDDDLSGRVERLLAANPRRETRGGWMGCLAAVVAVLLSGAVVTIVLQPAMLYPVHQFLENLIR